MSYVIIWRLIPGFVQFFGGKYMTDRWAWSDSTIKFRTSSISSDVDFSIEKYQPEMFLAITRSRVTSSTSRSMVWIFLMDDMAVIACAAFLMTQLMQIKLL